MINRALSGAAWEGAGPRRRRPAACGDRTLVRLRGVMLLAVGTACVAVAAPPATTQSGSTLPADLRAAIDEIEDFTPRFDYPGYYRLVEHVRQNAQPPGFSDAPIVIDDWTVLLETPSAYRGLAIEVEGVVGRNKGERSYPAYPDVGSVWRLELRKPGAPLSLTVICTEDVSDLPLESTIRIAGYFLQARTFKDSRGREQYAGLVVAKGPMQVSRVNPVQPRPARAWGIVIAFAGVGLVVGWILLRRAAATGSRRDVHTLRSHYEAPVNLADELADWAEDEDNSRER